jgi:hypothetical protein
VDLPVAVRVQDLLVAVHVVVAVRAAVAVHVAVAVEDKGFFSYRVSAVVRMLQKSIIINNSMF